MKRLPLPLRIICRLFECLFGLFWIPIYHLIGLFPRKKNLWIFVSWFGVHYSDNSRIFFEWINKNHPEIDAVWISRCSDVVETVRAKGFKAYKENSFIGIIKKLRAEKLFSSNAIDISYRLTNGIEHYALWHGMPLKKIGLDDKIGFYSSEGNQNLKNIYSKIIKILYPWKNAIWNYTKIRTVTNSEFFRLNLASAFGIYTYKILSTGSPRCDALFKNQKEDFIEKIRFEFPDSKILMYMPTFRKSAWNGEFFNPFSGNYGFNNEKFEAILDCNKIVFVYKPHFSDEKVMPYKKQGTRFFTLLDNDFNELYNFVGQIDILMTDYSSIYFDFLATGKPVILAPFDYEEYLTTARAHYFDYWAEMEGIKIRNWREFEDILLGKTYTPVSKKTQKKFAEYLDGNCCEKLWNEIMK